MNSELRHAESSHPDVDRIRSAVIADPQLILGDPQLVRALVQSEREVTRKVVDLRGVLVDRLESRLTRLERAHQTVIAAAYDNLAGGDQVHRAVLDLLEQDSFSDAIEVILDGMPVLLDVDETRICFESDTPEAGPVTGLGLGSRIEDAIIAAPAGALEAYLQLDRDVADGPVIMRRNLPEASLVFGEASGFIRCEALIPLDLGPEAPAAMLALGSSDPDRFTAEHGGDLLVFLGGVVERMLRRWLV